MYVIVEYMTCIAVTAGLIAFVLVGWVLLLEAHKGVKFLAKRESTPQPQDFARLKECRAPTLSATPADTNLFPPMPLSDDHKRPGARYPLPPGR